ncbi:16S rRNA (guanine(966)-N(2))-methyltransferase RsmD [Clostridium oceanicum]|uniref:16S rRNA (Guanine(966)-N(2))-methyltransferase RsmD n=1 Tax=Clostridium oceanicum TaxID=1543 RepID=A0ABN1JBA9_9CLOT
MRIISGSARGRKILSPESRVTRPTLDRIKESIFNIIQNRVYGSKVLDVFAGTGSLGLEAASRGAEFSYLIDRSPETYPLLRKNIENLKFEDICKSFNMDSYEGLKEFSRRNIVFDLIFVDPPYAKEMIPPAIKIIEEEGLLQKNGLIVSKIDSKEEIYEGSEKIKLVRHKKYGNTTICFYEYKED